MHILDCQDALATFLLTRLVSGVSGPWSCDSGDVDGCGPYDNSQKMTIEGNGGTKHQVVKIVKAHLSDPSYFDRKPDEKDNTMTIKTACMFYKMHMAAKKAGQTPSKTLGDVVKSMSGQTIEVINTDAEGRLVLADILWYAQKKFQPKKIIDLATLTGAIIVSIGQEKAGMFCNNKDFADELTKLGLKVGEEVWNMPVDDSYEKDIRSDIADMKNVGSGRGAGSTAGAIFLKRFIKNTIWMHLDIAGVTWAKSDRPMTPKGGSGFGVRLLDELVFKNFK